MDPISVTASILTVVTVAARISVGLEKLWCLREAPDVVFTIMNEINDLRALTTFMETSIKSVEPNTLELQQALDVVQTLAASAKRVLDELDTLIQQKLLHDPDLTVQGKKRVSRRAWLRHSKQLQRLYISLRTTRQNLAVSFSAISVSNLSQIKPLLLQIRDLFVMNKDHLTPVDHAVPDHVQNHVSIRSKLDQVITTLNDQNAACDQVSRASTKQPKSQSLKPGTDDFVLISTSVTLERCSSFCRCSCHLNVSTRTPQYVKDVLGHLFLGYMGTLSLGGNACNYPTCHQTARTSLRFSYAFPQWAIARAICITRSWRDLRGLGAAWTIRMPRLVRWGPIWSAIEHGDKIKILQMFKDGSASPFDINGTDGRSLLHHAIWYKRFDICHNIAIQGADWGHRDVDGSSVADILWPSLITGVGYEDQFLFKLRQLLERDYDFENMRFSSIHMIVAGLSRVPLSEQLVVDGSYVDARDAHGRTPLMWAAMRNDHESVTLLLQWRAKVSTQDHEGLTALHYAARQGSFDSAELLLLAGCEVDLPDYAGRTALIDFCFHSRAEETQLPLFKLFVRWHANVHFRSSRRWWTCLHMASSSGNTEILSKLLDMGVDINARNTDSNTPLMMAISEDRFAAAEMLLNRGARADFYDKFGRGTLMLAARYASVSLLQVLTSAKLRELDISATDHEGLTAHDHFEQGRKYLVDGKSLSSAAEVEKLKFESLLTSIQISPITYENRVVDHTMHIQKNISSDPVDDVSDTASIGSMSETVFYSCCIDLESGTGNS